MCKYISQRTSRVSAGKIIILLCVSTYRGTSCRQVSHMSAHMPTNVSVGKHMDTSAARMSMNNTMSIYVLYIYSIYICVLYIYIYSIYICNFLKHMSLHMFFLMGRGAREME